MRRSSALGGLLGLIALLTAGCWLGPAVATALALHRAADDPVALSDAILARTLTADEVATAIDDALSAGDADLADSLLHLADRHGVIVDAPRRAAVQAAVEGSPLDTALTFARGMVVGDQPGAAGLGGAFAGDLVGIGDVRDLARQGWLAANGERPDRLVMGLAAAGLAVTAVTWISAGEAAPVRGGLSLIKAMRKGGRLGAAMTASLGRLVRSAVDLDGLALAARNLGRLELGAARRVAAGAVRPQRLAPLAAMGRDTVTVARRAGTRAVDDAFALARSPADLSRAARLSEGMGRATRGALKLLGRGALLLATGLSALAGMMLTGLLWLLAFAMLAARFGRWLGGLRLARPPAAGLRLS